MEVKNEKKVLGLSFLGVLTFIAIVVGATYAYFTAQGGTSANTNVNVQTATTDNLSFQTGSAISLTANQEDFGSGSGNKSGETFARATLTANNATNNATRNYYIYLSITSNNFEYTTEDEQAELLLKVTAPDGSEVTTLGGLTRKTSGGETGFDITTQMGLITIADNYEITSTGTETQEWQVEVIFVNLDSDQNANTGKSFSANLIIREDKLPSTLADVCPEGGNFSDCIVKLYDERNQEGANGLYYHDGLGTYTNADQEAGDNSYRYSGGDYQLTKTSIAEGLTKLYTIASTETNGVINFYCNGEKMYIGYELCKTEQTHYYTLAYNEENQYETLQDAINQAVSDGYLTADNIRNFVCFGTGAENETCSEDNLYRIIGVFDGQVKLVKYTIANPIILGEDGNYYDTYTDNFMSGMKKNAGIVYRYRWNYTNGSLSPNDWETSELNIINLNTNYWNYLQNDWQSKIANHIWQVGGNTLENIENVTARIAYENEILNPFEVKTYQDEIGLIYVSDYMYAMDPSGWLSVGTDDVTLNDYGKIKENNWLYTGFTYWTISPLINDSVTYSSSFSIYSNGSISSHAVYNLPTVLPTFYLNSNVEFASGTGKESDPYRIVI